MKPLAWMLCFSTWFLAVTGGAALAGGVAFAGGAILGGRSDWLQASLIGLHHFGFMGFVWAPAVALVMTVKRAHERQARPAENGDGPPSS